VCFALEVQCGDGAVVAGSCGSGGGWCRGWLQIQDDRQCCYRGAGCEVAARLQWQHLLLDVAAAVVDVGKRQLAVWLMEMGAGRPLVTLMSYSNMKSAERLPVLDPHAQCCP
jgi:hypothetical protein